MTTLESRAAAFGWIWLLVPTALPLACAVAFSTLIPGLSERPGDVSAALLPMAERKLVHLGSLLTYGAVGFLHVTLCLCAVGVFLFWISRLPLQQRRPALAALGLAAALLVSFVLYAQVAADDMPLVRVSFKSICDLMIQADLGPGLVQRCYGAGNESALTALSWIPTFTGMATVVVAVGLVAGLATPLAGEDEAGWRDFFERRMRLLQNVLYVLSAVLVTSTICIVLFSSLPVGLLGKGPTRDAVSAFAQGLGAFWGVVFTLTLIGTVLPAALLLFRAARKHESSVAASEEVQTWLREHVYVSARRQLANVAIMLAPLIAGPAGGLLEKSFG